MASLELNQLLERLRIQSIVQRLKRDHGSELALQVLQQAVEIEFGLNTRYEQTKQTRITKQHKSWPGSD
jgi:hypothetical protein